MTQDDVVVNLFALAHPGRLEVFRLIAKQEEAGLAAGIVAKTLGFPANTTSTHLSILTGAGLLSAYRDGRSIIYRANFEHFAQLLGFLLKDVASNHQEAQNSLLDLMRPEFDENN